MDTEQKRKTVLITGASRGLGKSLAFEFAQRNFNLVLCSRDTHLLKQHCDVINQAGGNANFCKCDVTDLREIETAIDFAMSKFGKIDIAIFNAGIGGGVSFADFDPAVFQNVINTNLIGVVNGIASVAKVMKQQRFGTIMGISSLADTRAIPGNSAYIASKAALTLMMEAAQIELKPLGINVVTVRPGFIKTDMTSQTMSYMPLLMGSDKAAKKIANGILRNRGDISFPFPMAILSFLTKIIPSFLWRYLMKIKKWA